MDGSPPIAGWIVDLDASGWDCFLDVPIIASGRSFASRIRLGLEIVGEIQT
jgi:hypothetical protein